MKKQLLSIFIFLLALDLRAQEAVSVIRVETSIQELMNASVTGQVTTFDKRYQGVRGTPALFDDWQPGQVVMRGNLIIKDIKLNYDAYNDMLMFMKPDGQAMYAAEGKVEWFVIGEEGEGNMMLFKKKTIKIDRHGKKTERYVRVISEGEKMELYQVFGKQFLKADYERAYSADRRYDEFVDESYFIVFKKGEGPEKFNPGRKNLLKLFADRKSELESYISENNPELDKPEDLGKVFAWYEALSTK